MKLTLSQARRRLSELCTLTQDPRAVIVLTRYGKPVAALVSMEEARRIWELDNTERSGWRHGLSGVRDFWSRRRMPGMEPGPDGTYVTAREAALQVRDIQTTRAEERRILARGGLEPVEGGELGERVGWWRRTLRRLKGQRPTAGGRSDG